MAAKRDKAGKRRQQVTGYCNACGQFAPLTWDHVPPQGSIAITRVEVMNFLAYVCRRGKNSKESVIPKELLSAHFVGTKRDSQNGLRFQTLCGRCNNTLLGGRYDPELKRACRRVGVVLRAAERIHLPGNLDVQIQTHRLLRSIVGHLMAAHGSKDQNSPLPGFEQGLWHDLREYFLDESLPIPPHIRVYYWPFPNTRHVIVPALGISSWDGKHSLLGAMIKFFPLAFCVVDTAHSDLTLDVPYFAGDGCHDLACKINLFIDLTRIPAEDWPELQPNREFYTVLPPEASSVAAPHPNFASE
jgi:hypothetical protein